MATTDPPSCPENEKIELELPSLLRHEIHLAADAENVTDSALIRASIREKLAGNPFYEQVLSGARQANQKED